MELRWVKIHASDITKDYNKDYPSAFRIPETSYYLILQVRFFGGELGDSMPGKGWANVPVLQDDGNSYVVGLNPFNK